MCEIASEFEWEEVDFWCEVAERGYTPKDFFDPDWAREQMENYGMI